MTPAPSLVKLVMLSTKTVEPLPVNGWLGFWIRLRYSWPVVKLERQALGLDSWSPGSGRRC